MFTSFTMQGDNSPLEGRPVSPAQTPPVSTTQSTKASDDTLLDAVATLSKGNGMTVVRHGARLAVIGELLVALLKHLPAAMQAEVAGVFRDRIEDLMSLSDGRRLPEQYHSALLTEVNRYLNALR
jgi:hypothetical protein